MGATTSASTSCCLACPRSCTAAWRTASTSCSRCMTCTLCGCVSVRRKYDCPRLLCQLCSHFCVSVLLSTRRSSNGDGFISFEEAIQFVQMHADPLEWAQFGQDLITSVDINGDGVVSRYVALLCGFRVCLPWDVLGQVLGVSCHGSSNDATMTRRSYPVGCGCCAAAGRSLLPAC